MMIRFFAPKTMLGRSALILTSTLAQATASVAMQEYAKYINSPRSDKRDSENKEKPSTVVKSPKQTKRDAENKEPTPSFRLAP